MIPIQVRKNGVSFCVHVLPRSAKCALAGAQEGALRLKLTAPPVDGKANDECLEFLAGILGVKKGQMDIISGHTSRRKIVADHKCDPRIFGKPPFDSFAG